MTTMKNEMDEGNETDNKVSARIAKWKVTNTEIKYREQKYSIDDSSQCFLSTLALIQMGILNVF